MPYTQQEKLISIATPLGPDVLLLTAISGVEAISETFSFELSMLSENHAVPFDRMIGKSATVTIRLGDAGKRYINGIISSFSQGRGGGEGGSDPRFSCYRATLVPWLWVLTKRSDCRIFQNRSVAEIVEEVFKGHGFGNFRFELISSYTPREFCVQYHETDYDFVSRLLEEEGIFYFFVHEKDRHTLVLADAPGAHKPCPGQKAASCQLSGGAVREKDVITSFEITRRVGASRYTAGDFNFKVPKASLVVEAQGRDKREIGNREIYEHPGHYDNKASGGSLAKIRMEEDEARSIEITGTGDCRGFAPGFRFALEGHHREDLNAQDYLLVSVHHEASEGYGDDGGFIYENSFKCLPHNTPYRPRRQTPKPVINGAQTAIVVGPPGEEIYTDEFGRVKVQFHWDRAGKSDDKSSCWIRVSQLSAGNGFGALQLPRVGQEVVVDFLEGDPDRPIIVGQLYNGVNLPPYSLPAHKTKSCFRSQSSPNGEGFNEIRFEDKKGEEQLFIHAEKQQDHRVKGDSLEWVGEDRHQVVLGDLYRKVSGDQHLTVAGDRNEKVTGTVSLTAGSDLQQKVGGKHALDAGEEIHLKAGARLIVESGGRISLKVGASFIDIGPAGVSIVGPCVLINQGGTAGFGSGAAPDLPRPPKEADRLAEAKADGKKRPEPPTAGPQAESLKSAARDHKMFCAV
jgi:type VI secretion system secreted protein VgrG